MSHRTPDDYVYIGTTADGTHVLKTENEDFIITFSEDEGVDSYFVGFRATTDNFSFYENEGAPDEVHFILHKPHGPEEGVAMSFDLHEPGLEFLMVLPPSDLGPGAWD